MASTLELFRSPLFGLRHLQIIYDINLFFLRNVERKFPNDRDRLARMSLIEEGNPQKIRMAHLAIVGSHTVNGVARLHSELVRNVIFKDFAEMFGPSKFQNKTNGITPRRWLHQANSALSDLITETLGSAAWLKDLSLLEKLRPLADDAAFRQRWRTIKYENKCVLAALIQGRCGVAVSPDALFDVQVKRIHEYKRQLLNILG